MSDVTDTRDRVIRVETEMAAVKQQLKDVNDKLDAIHEIFLQAKGAKYFIVAAAGLFGFLSAWAPSLVSYLSGLPK